MNKSNAPINLSGGRALLTWCTMSGFFSGSFLVMFVWHVFTCAPVCVGGGLAVGLRPSVHNSWQTRTPALNRRPHPNPPSFAPTQPHRPKHVACHGTAFSSCCVWGVSAVKMGNLIHTSVFLCVRAIACTVHICRWHSGPIGQRTVGSASAELAQLMLKQHGSSATH